MSLRAILTTTAGTTHLTCAGVTSSSDQHSPPVFAVP
jgi:hypothetical protein